MALRDLRTDEAIDVASLVVETGALQKVPQPLALREDVLSFYDDGNELSIVVPESSGPETVERIRFSTGMRVRRFTAPRAAIRQRLGMLYGEHAAASGASATSAVAVLDEIHRDALKLSASDIHIEPGNGEGRVRLRVNGILVPGASLGQPLYAQVVSRIKVLAGMDIADRRQPQDGRYAITAGERVIDARVSSVPAIGGEKLAIRILNHHAAVPNLDALGIPANIYELLRRAVRGAQGFIVSCGPTGSGKTTTLYALLRERELHRENACSVEDPIEIRLPGVTQVQVNARAGVTFASASRAFLRQDPDVIMIGEMRDRETAAVAATASLSGQFLLTTLHSTDAPSAIERLVELGVQRRTIAGGVSALVAQRLIRTLCVCCRRPCAEGVLASKFRLGAGASVFQAAGCAECHNTGYSGRAAIFEALFFDDAMREAVTAGASNAAMVALARTAGYRPMLEHGLVRFAAGETTIEELRRVLAAEHLW